MKQTVLIGSFLGVIIIAGSSCGQVKKLSAGDLFTASAFTPVHSFTSGAEGPAVDKAGVLYAVNMEREGTIGEVLPSGERRIFLTLPEGSIGNGIRFNSQGDMFIADYPKHNVLRVTMSDKQVSVYAHEPRMNQPNDIAIDSKDRFYASDPNWKDSTGRIWRVDPGGTVTLLEDSMGTTNGIEVSPDDKTLYVNESVQRKVWAYDLAPDGTISNKRLLIEFPDFGMDGMKCDSKGNLYITRYGKGTVAIFNSGGRQIQEVELKGKDVSNITFGGKDDRTCFVTLQDRKCIEKFRTDISGK